MSTVPMLHRAGLRRQRPRLAILRSLSTKLDLFTEYVKMSSLCLILLAMYSFKGIAEMCLVTCLRRLTWRFQEG